MKFFSRGLPQKISAAGEGGDTAVLYPTRMMLPKDLSGVSQKAFESEGGRYIPLTVQPISREEECGLIGKMVEDINNTFGLSLCCSIKELLPEDEKAKPLALRAKSKFIVCGGSHAMRLARALKATGSTVVDLTVPGWRSTKEACDDLATTLEELSGGDDAEEYNLVFEMMDNTSYYSSTEDDGLATIKKDAEDNYHVPGKLTVAPRELALQFLANTVPAVLAGKAERRIFITPLPRYLFEACCGNESHCSTGHLETFPKELLGGLSQFWRTAKEFFRGGRAREVGIDVINPTWLLTGEARTTIEEQLETLKEVQGPLGDPVHLSAEGYFKMAAGILKVTREEKSRGSRKRKREESFGEDVPAASLSHGPGPGQASRRGWRGGWVGGRVGSYNPPNRGYNYPRYRGAGRARGGRGGW